MNCKYKIVGIAKSCATLKFELVDRLDAYLKLQNFTKARLLYNANSHIIKKKQMCQIKWMFKFINFYRYFNLIVMHMLFS